MSAEPMLTSDIIGLTKAAPFSRRGFMTASAAVTGKCGGHSPLFPSCAAGFERQRVVSLFCTLREDLRDVPPGHAAARRRREHQPRDRVLQFPHVARPMVAGHELEGARRETRRGPAEAVPCRLEQPVCDRRQVVRPRTQRRHDESMFLSLGRR